RSTNDETAAELSEAVVHALARMADQRSGVAEVRSWFTPARYSPSRVDLLGFPRSQYNLGIAHGIPGVIAFLAADYRKGMERNICRELITESVPWLLQFRHASTDGGFPNWLTSKLRAYGGRTAWCYGEPGVAAATWAAGEALDKPAWKAA